jgi:phenylalanyl-tRNA synthetase beta chain
MKALSKFSIEDEGKYWKIINPLSEEENVLVNTRLPRLIMNVLQNIKYKMMNIKLFEIGKTFSFNTKDSKVLVENESLNLAGVVSGCESYDSWKIKNEKIDFYYVSGLLKSFLECFGVFNTKMEYENISYLDKSYSAKIISSDGNMLGVLGKLNKKIMTSFDIKQDLYVWELCLDKIILARQIEKTYKPISQYPYVERDLSLLVPNDVTANKVIDIISSETKNDV